MPMCRMPVSAPKAPASIASTSARIRWRRAVARSTSSGAPLPRSATWVAGRPSLEIDDLAGEQARRAPPRSPCRSARSSESLDHIAGRGGSWTNRNRCRRRRRSVGSAGRARPRTARRASACGRLLSGRPWPAHIMARPGKCHPSLTSAIPPETSSAMASPFSPRSADSRSAPRSATQAESAGSLARFILTLVDPRLGVRSFVVAPFNIPSGSMLPTLYIGDYLFVAKWPYGYSRYSFPFGFPAVQRAYVHTLPKRGDVVVFRHPAENTDLIKRVIGLPGDTVAVARRTADPQRQACPSQALAAVRDADEREQPVQGRPACHAEVVVRHRAAPTASIPRYLRDACPAARATPCSTRSITGR